MDMDFDGYFDSYGLMNCKTTAISITGVQKADTPGEYNYCFDERGGMFTDILSVGGKIVGAAGAVIACVASSGTVFILGAGLTAALQPASPFWDALLYEAWHSLRSYSSFPCNLAHACMA